MWNAIDPNIIVDENGTPWMSFGSFWDGIKMVKLTDDMMQVAQPEEWHSLCRRERSFELDDKDPGDGAVEAPFIMKHGDYYYLFVSFDYCCRGKDSTWCSRSPVHYEARRLLLSLCFVRLLLPG